MPVSIQRTSRSAADAIDMPAIDGQVVTGACVFYGATITNETGAQIRIHIVSGTSASGIHVGGLTVSNNSTDHIWYGDNGIACPSGIYLDVVSGTPANGAIFYSMA
jgi:hypothetical protein